MEGRACQAVLLLVAPIVDALELLVIALNQGKERNKTRVTRFINC
jgi:hypothetical protein